MTAVRTVWILGDQLSPANAALAQADRERDVVLMVESKGRGSMLRYHKKKLVLVYAAMRHFAGDLEKMGWSVDYHRLGSSPDFEDALRRHLEARQPGRILLAEPNSLVETEAVKALGRKLRIDLELVPTTQFLCGRDEFREWAGESRRLVMENHYRRMRRKTGYLMHGGKPVGGRWNFDVRNRRTIADWRRLGQPGPGADEGEEPDAVTREVMDLVAREFPGHPGDAAGFSLPVDRAGARRWLGRFIAQRLERFGDFEDLMVAKEPRLFHSLLSPLLNLGLLAPRECVEAALQAYEGGRAPLNAVEGFVRQIIGWREFINGIYWLRGAEYRELNALGAERQLPAWFYSGKTDMHCMRRVLGQVVDTGWNHHIQRLMVLGNFILLAGIRPQEALRWFLEMYVDAFDWVMAANVIGMICHADGGFMATKPYAAGAAYINRMSDYCGQCTYDPAVKTGAGACPFNYLYWSFYDKHADRFARNPRTRMPVMAWKKRREEDREEVRRWAARFLDDHVPARG